MLKFPKIRLLYDISFFILAVIAVYISICDIVSGCNEFQLLVDNIITIIFIFDYVIRLAVSKNKKEFVKQNVLDLIAIIPFNSLFKVFRVFKIFKVLRVLKLARVSAYFARLYKHIKFFFDINGLKYMVVICVICIISGGIAIHFAEDMSVSDGIWWSFVTATTVGYGDISPSTPIGRIIASILMLVGIGLIGSLTSTITALFFQKHDRKTNAKQDIIKSIQNQLDSFDDLSDDDIDVICSIIKSLHTEKQLCLHGS